MVYIREAHAVDEWPLGNLVTIKQHQTLEERIDAAKTLNSELNFNIPTVVDSMDNIFNKTFQSWPERYYILQGNSILKIAEPANEFGFDRLSLRNDLAMFTKTELDELPEDKYPVHSPTLISS